MYCHTFASIPADGHHHGHGGHHGGHHGSSHSTGGDHHSHGHHSHSHHHGDSHHSPRSHGTKLQDKVNGTVVKVRGDNHKKKGDKKSKKKVNRVPVNADLDGNVSCFGCFPSRKGHLGALDSMPEDISPTAKSMIEHRQMMSEMRTQNYDVIRFATYRTACKLRFIQKKTNLGLVDLWNMIEAFRESGLHTLDHGMEVNISKLQSLLTTIYSHLNKRLPPNQQINVDKSINLTLSWLLSACEKKSKGKMRVFFIKVSLTTMCAGKLMDKLRYMFTQVSDSSGSLVKSKFEDYLKAILSLPGSIYEGPSFHYTDTAARACFNGKNKVTLNDFLDTLMADPGPQCLMWLPILHRMAAVENVFHPIQCEGCNRDSFMGFRYKCQRCYNYHLCQDCFWRGRTSGNHNNDHEMKEYSSYGYAEKSPAKQIGHSLRKSFRCVPAKATNNKIPVFPETPEKTLDLSHIVPPTPTPVHNGFPETALSQQSIDVSENSSVNKSPSRLASSSVDASRIDDEHRLIARYAARLAADASNAARSPVELNYSMESSKVQRDMIAQLEAKNREIMREIQKLKVEQEAAGRASSEAQANPTLLAELRLLRQRKDELEGRMSALQESRRELMVQLESLMKLLKNHGSPRSTPGSSPKARTYSPVAVKTSSPSTPGDSLTGVGGDVRQAFSTTHHAVPSNARNLRNDLLVAADSVTNAMSSLVKELNSEASSDSEDEDNIDNHRKCSRGFETGESSAMESSDEIMGWQEDVQRRLGEEAAFIEQIRARKEKPLNRGLGDIENDHYIPTDDGESYVRTDDESVGLNTDDGESYIRTDDESNVNTENEDAELYDQDPKELFPRYQSEDESYMHSDAESYIRTDDEEGGNAEWEEAMKRWVNR
ncbi:dystrobrevin beta isoform X3 [Lingula anatina]|uniref:Dystrobrevin beta isoform X3 n=1 Tax=Lingula anatina TaxID=7574 RepID=A0A1S3JT52_LINAN|nr:dystrobrevin beta isoform X3 [Lingula anatina]|eukprot:XP_013413234.1 dystrobrevin beta isoform X3 [Lingula anatina]